MRTNKSFFLSIIILALYTSLFAQTDQSQEVDLKRAQATYYIQKGDHVLNASVGLLNLEEFSFSLFQASGGGKPSPSFNLSYEYGLTDRIRIAAFTNYYRVNGTDNLNISDLGSVLSALDCLFNPSACNSAAVEERINVLTLGGKLGVSKSVLPGLDTYASTYLGYSFNRRKTVTESAIDSASDQLGLGIEIPTVVYYGSFGARYFVTNKIGVWAEYGLGNVHLLKIGTSFRLK